MPGLLLIPLLIYYIIHFYLDSSAAFWFPLLIEFPLLLSFAEFKLKSIGKSAQYIQFIRIGSFSVLIAGFLFFIIMLPASLYQAWLRLLDAGKPTGMISFTFAYAGGLVSSIGCVSLMHWKNKIQALLNLLLLCIIVALILYPLPSVFLIFLTLLLIKLLIIQKENPLIITILSIVFILIPALTAAFLFPLQNTDPRGSRIVDKLSGNIQKSVYRIFPGLPLVLQIPGYGYNYDQVRKSGEKPVLSSNICFFVEADPGTVLYLRSDVFYKYLNGNWLSEPPVTGEKQTTFAETESLRKIILTVETDLYTRVLNNSWTKYYRIDGEMTALNSWGSFETLSGLPLRRGDKITLFDSVGNAPIPDDETLKKQLGRGLQIPSDLEEELNDLAKRLEGDSEKQSLFNIKKYFRDEFKYTLETKSSEQMVLDFLNKTKEGYCVHFSTSAALLARSLGIPVRMAQGFLVQIPKPDDPESYDRGNPYSVTGYSAHQWPEIYIDERGWIPWEVTPPFEELGDSMIQDNILLDDYTREQLMQMGVVLSEEDGNDNRSFMSDLFSNWKRLILTSGLLLLTLIFYLLYRSRNLILIINRKIRLAEKKHGVAPPSETGWIQWFRNQKGDQKDRCQILILRLVYHKESFGKNERKELLRLIKEL